MSLKRFGEHSLVFFSLILFINSGDGFYITCFLFANKIIIFLKVNNFYLDFLSTCNHDHEFSVIFRDYYSVLILDL